MCSRKGAEKEVDDECGDARRWERLGVREGPGYQVFF